MGLIALAVVLLTLPTGDLPSPSADGNTPASVTATARSVPAAAANPPAVPATPPAPSRIEPATAAAPTPASAPVNATINSSALPRNAVVRLDGKSVARRRLSVPAGRHILEAAVPGYSTRVDTIRLASGQDFVWVPKLVPSASIRAAAGNPPQAEPRPSADPHRTSDDATCRQRITAGAWRDALEPCERAAKSGGLAAQRDVASMFQHGNGVPRSDDSAAHWYAGAARGGDPESMYQLAQAYERGHGMKKDAATAFSWYSRAASAGHADAQYTVGEAYEKGRFAVAKDRTKALDWYRKAAAQGQKDAVNKVRDLRP